jgi:hypothetical protein
LLSPLSLLSPLAPLALLAPLVSSCTAFTISVCNPHAPPTRVRMQACACLHASCSARARPRAPVHVHACLYRRCPGRRPRFSGPNVGGPVAVGLAGAGGPSAGSHADTHRVSVQGQPPGCWPMCWGLGFRTPGCYRPGCLPRCLQPSKVLAALVLAAP